MLQHSWLEMAEALSDSESELDPQRGFSMLILTRGLQFKQRDFDCFKFNSLECCYELTFTEKLLTEWKKATSKAVKPNY